MIEVIPAERDKKAAEMQKFMSWWVRKNKKIIKNSAERAIWLMILNGMDDSQDLPTISAKG